MLELAILGLLKEQPHHGYELKKQLAEVMGPLSRVSFGSLYPALARLETNGRGPGDRRAGNAPGPRHGVARRRTGGLQGSSRWSPPLPGSQGLRNHPPRPRAVRRAPRRRQLLGRRRTRLRPAPRFRPLSRTRRAAASARAPPRPSRRAARPVARSSSLIRRREQRFSERRLPQLNPPTHHRNNRGRHLLARPADRGRAGTVVLRQLLKGNTSHGQQDSALRSPASATAPARSSRASSTTATPIRPTRCRASCTSSSATTTCGDVEFVAAFDVDAAKVGLDLGKAIFAGQNNTMQVRARRRTSASPSRRPRPSTVSASTTA